MRVKASRKAGGNDDRTKSFVAGAVAGTFSKTVTAPLSRLTIMRQVAAAEPGMRQVSMYAEFLGTVKTKGVRHLFRGNTAAVCHKVPFSGVYHGTYSVLKGWTGQETFWFRLGNGSVAGAAACIAAYPLDLARSLIASGKSETPSLVKTLWAEGKRGGGRTLYRGLWPTLLQVTPNLGVNYAVYDTCSQFFASDKKPTIGSTLSSAASAGIASSLATHPLDVIRRVIQTDGAAGTSSRFNGSFSAAWSTIVASNSPRALWRGLTPELLKVVPSVCLTFSMFEFMKSTVL
eukprot:TRINITY_DN14030_c0_g1_i1.p1 TRINITY_DN14030_c0_g1~~TRINITY_DN14030_c0_g1_i1.p1  ORF type:complete len:289 (+),score=59.24 TRINITY_DN14030_c0_g1_i1:31-897(+)